MKHKELQNEILYLENKLIDLYKQQEKAGLSAIKDYHNIGLFYCRLVKTRKELSTLVTPNDFKRVKNSSNGNPRYVIHYLKLAKVTGKFSGSYKCLQEYEDTLKSVKQFFSVRKYHNKQYGGGIIFESYNIDQLCEKLNKYMEELR